ncbi:MAG: DMT family transporter [Alphaproteobacteria bacterium]
MWASLQRRWLALPGDARGALWVLIGAVGFSITAALVKSLGETLDSFQIAFFRSVFGLAVLAPLVLRAGPAVLRTSVPMLHIGRSLAGATAMMCGFYALTHLPLATATAVSFTRPLFMIVIAVAFLGEAVRWRRWSATAIGFLGVLIMVRPGRESLDPAILVALGQALAASLAVALIKKMPADEPHLTVLFYVATVATLASLGPALWVWRTPSLGELGLALAMGVVGVGAQAAAVRGFRAGEATVVAPFDYARLLFAGALGYLLFFEVPDLWTLLGAVVIVVSTVYIAWRDAQLGAPKTGPAPD